MKGDWGRGVEGIQKLAITILLQMQYHLTPVKKVYCKEKKRKKITSIGEKVQERESLGTAGGNVN